MHWALTLFVPPILNLLSSLVQDLVVDRFGLFPRLYPPPPSPPPTPPSPRPLRLDDETIDALALKIVESLRTVLQPIAEEQPTSEEPANT